MAEVTALGVPSILIPSPYVTNNHQEKNARGLERAGAAVVIVERDLTGDSLLQSLTGLLHDAQRWEQMRENSLTLGMPRAATDIVAQLRALSRKK